MKEFTLSKIFANVAFSAAVIGFSTSIASAAPSCRDLLDSAISLSAAPDRQFIRNATESAEVSLDQELKVSDIRLAELRLKNRPKVMHPEEAEAERALFNRFAHDALLRAKKAEGNYVENTKSMLLSKKVDFLADAAEFRLKAAKDWDSYRKTLSSLILLYSVRHSLDPKMRKSIEFIWEKRFVLSAPPEATAEELNVRQRYQDIANSDNGRGIENMGQWAGFQLVEFKGRLRDFYERVNARLALESLKFLETKTRDEWKRDVDWKWADAQIRAAHDDIRILEAGDVKLTPAERVLRQQYLLTQKLKITSIGATWLVTSTFPSGRPTFRYSVDGTVEAQESMLRPETRLELEQAITQAGKSLGHLGQATKAAINDFLKGFETLFAAEDARMKESENRQERN